MKVGSARILSVAAGMLLLAAPVVARGSAVVSYDGIGFTFDASLGQSVNIARVRATRSDMSGVADPAHLSFTLYGTRDDGSRPPPIGGRLASPREVRVYEAAALVADTANAGQLTALERLIEERPDPAGMSTADGPVATTLPVMPPVTEAARIVQARVTYIDTPEVSGVSYVASYAQDTLPPTSDELQWTFQGLSPDGAWYVSIIWGLHTDVLPAKLPRSVFDRLDSDWPAVLGEATATIETAPPDAFTPDLDSLDALARSLVLPDAAVASPGPSPAS